MAKCNNCGSYYRLSEYHNDKQKCEECSVHSISKHYFDEEEQEEINNILHPSGKTEAIRYDD